MPRNANRTPVSLSTAAPKPTAALDAPVKAAEQAEQAEQIDATKITAPVLTAQGWVVPEQAQRA